MDDNKFLLPKFVLAFILLLFTFQINGQNLNFTFKEVALKSVLKEISNQTNYDFAYSSALKTVDSLITIEARNENPLSFFKRVFPSLGLLYKIDNNQVLLSTREIAYPADKITTQTIQKDERKSFTLVGKVNETNGEPLTGVSIYNISKNIVSSTDLDGKYTINASVGDRIEASFMGFATKNFQVSSAQEVNFIMTSESSLLDEIVVVGYGTTKKSSLVGSVNIVNSSKIEDRPITTVASALYGAAPGVLSTSSSGIPGDGPDIRIRGFGTINSSSAPVIVVDGAVFDLSLRTINPNDIESISILKDAASTAIYGSRGANGVIMITTKKGSKDKMRLSVNASVGISSRFIDNHEGVTPQDYYQLMFEAKRNALVYGSNVDIADANILAGRGGLYNGVLYSGIYDELLYNPFKGIDNNEIIDTSTGLLNPAATKLKWGDDLDWFKPMMRLGRRNDASVSMSGGTDKSDYYTSLGVLDDNAWMKRSFTKRYSIRGNVNFQPLKWLKLGVNIFGSVVDSYNQDWSGASSTNPIYTARMMGQIYPVHLHNLITGAYLTDSDGNRIYDTGGQTIDGITYPVRPFIAGNRNLVAELLADDMQYRRGTLQSKLYFEISFLKDFKFTMNANLDNSMYMGYSYRSNKVGAYAGAGRASRTNRTNLANTFQQLLTYSKNVGKHEIDALIGHESYETETRYNTMNKSGQIVDGNIELVNFADILTATSYTLGSRVEGFLSRVNYAYDKGRYVVEASFRRDGSSKFFRDVRWGNFYSFGAGWNMEREDFLKDVKWINLLKVRGSHGVNGNLEGISNYSWQDLYILNNNNQSEPGYLQDVSAGNRALTWEKQIQTSLGLDFALFRNSLRGSVELYNKTNDDLLFRVILPASTGITSQYQNIGTMNNKGLEVDLAYDFLKSEQYVWTVGVNASTLRNRITKMPDDNPELISGTKKLMVGRSLYDFWLRDYYGVDPRDGAALFLFDEEEDWDAATCRTMEDGTLVTTSHNNAKYNYKGTAIPSLYGNFYTSFHYRNFSGIVQFGYQIGGLTYDSLLAQMSSSGNYGYSLSDEMVRRWQKEGDITDVPRMDDSKISVYNVASSRFLTSASYLYLNMASLSYQLSNKIARSIGVNSCSLTLSGENLLLIAARKGLNPMESFDGVTSSQYTPSRVVTLGLKMNL